MLTERVSGVLLHPTSLPTRFGVGDLGPAAVEWIEWLAAAGQSYWQVLPLVPTAAGESPYQSPSAFAGHPLLISPERLFEDGLLSRDQLEQVAVQGVESAPRVDFLAVRERKHFLLEAAAEAFWTLAPDHELRQSCDAFSADQANWLEPHCEFLALREANGSRAWTEWTELVTSAKTPAPEAAAALRNRMQFHRFCQFAFWRQWAALRQQARDRGLRIIGDIPIYVSHDSADVWANRELFQLDVSGRSTRVAGVPPDYFSETGQLWSNPLYDWEGASTECFRWWIQRIRASLALVDLVRLDHFRGFEAYWSVPAEEKTAINGEWIPGPAADLFAAIALGVAPHDESGQPDMRCVPLIAEDLGMITEPVHALRKQFLLPGMNVLQFQLPGSVEEPYAPEKHELNSVVYTGTHDNDTSLGWFRSDVLPFPERLERLKTWIPCDEADFAWEFIELAWSSPAALAVAPLQDVLNLGPESRMNTPGTSGDESTNWCWKFQPGALTAELAARLRDVTARKQRLG